MVSVKDLYYPRSEDHVDYSWSDEAHVDHNGEPSYEFWEATMAAGRTYVYATEDAAWTSHYLDGGIRSEEGDFEMPDELSYLGDVVGGPIMNGYWPLGYDLAPLGTSPRFVAAKLVDMPVCLVQVDGLYGIALTGGGMDLSWELANSAIVAGFMPWLGLEIHQGSPDSTWAYGIGQIGKARAARVRAALRYRYAVESRRLRNKAADLREWR